MKQMGRRWQRVAQVCGGGKSGCILANIPRSSDIRAMNKK